MNKLQKFMAEHPFLTEETIKELEAIERLCPVLVRCERGRFTCGAQDAQHFIRCVELGGDYVRDVSFPAVAVEWARTWTEETPLAQTLARAEVLKAAGHAERGLPRIKPITTKLARIGQEFNEADCGGAFDGSQVTSDADSGL